jgi:hypothetical protein
MTKICKNCEYFKYSNSVIHPKYQGECSNPNFIYTGDGEELVINGLGYWDYESYNAGFDVGAEFGCIHFKEKEEK